MSSNDIVKSWYFKSSSSDKEYETLQYADGHTSCGCPGWCMKKADKKRECKHTRAVESHNADRTCTRIGVDRTQEFRSTAIREQIPVRGKAEEPARETVKPRKIIWKE